jgi:glucan 1,3-beta-glucosidase
LLLAYKKEDCASDPGWCFTAAVGNSLPSTFFAYGQSAQNADHRTGNATDNLIMPTVSTSLLNIMNAHAKTTANQKRAAAARPHLAHRFASIHARGDGDATAGAGDRNASATKGYTDGLTTAKVFAAYNMSRLGFAGQFMADAVRAAGPTLIAAGTEDGYHGGFMKGLKEGETLAVS